MNEHQIKIHEYATKVKESIRWAIDDYEEIFWASSPTFPLEAHIYWKLKVDGWLEEPRPVFERGDK